MSERRTSSAHALQIKGLNVYYGASHALQGVDLELSTGVLSVVGRNGMGKTTLCKAIMGLVPVASGSIRFAGSCRSFPKRCCPGRWCCSSRAPGAGGVRVTVLLPADARGRWCCSQLRGVAPPPARPSVLLDVAVARA